MEPALYCVAACLVALRPFLSTITPRTVRDYSQNLINKCVGDRLRVGETNRVYQRDPAVELGHWRRNDFNRLRTNGSADPIFAEAGASALIDANMEDGIDGLNWPSREFLDAVHVKKEIWVSRTPYSKS